MNRSTLRKSARTAAVAMLAAALVGAMPAMAAEPVLQPDEVVLTGETPAATPAFWPASRPDVSVFFQDYSIAFPANPIIVQERMMVPGGALLAGLGYAVQWDAEQGRLTAVKEGNVQFAYEAGQMEAEIAGEIVNDMPVVPFIQDDMLWIPLRVTLEASGMTVDWDQANRMAIVKDPHALPKFSVAVRANAEVALQSSELEAYLKSVLNANASIDLIPPVHYRDKINVMIAAGDLKSLMLLPNVGQFPTELIPSIAMDLTDLLDGYPRLKELAEDPDRSLVMDGRLYGIPFPQDPHDAPFPALRQDWLNVLGLAQPKTMDELYQVLKKFKDFDPVGNGKHDTYGLAGYTTAGELGSFAWVEHVYTGSPYRFSVKDGEVIDHAVSEAEVKALEWLAKAYREGLIDPEFAVVNEQQAIDRLRDGRAGVSALSISEMARLSAEGDADWVPLPGLQADANSAMIAPWATQDPGIFIISRMTRIDPTLILAWLEHGIAMADSGQWVQDEKLTAADHAALRSLFGSSDLLQEVSSLQGIGDAERTTYETAIESWRNVSYAATSVPNIESLWRTGKYADLNSQLIQMKIKVIMGVASIDDWKHHVQQLVASDEYQEMMAELNRLTAK